MSEIRPDELGARLHAADDDVLLPDVRHREAFVDALVADVPDHPPNFECVKRVTVGQESVPDEELADLELGPNDCAAE
jgi:hypothetical protein